MKRFLLLLLLLSGELSGAGQALMVVGNTALAAGDSYLHGRLTGAGYTVQVVDDTLSQSSDATGKDLVYISESVNSPDVNTKFRDVAVPVIVSEAYLFDDMRMTGPVLGTDHEYIANQTSIYIRNPANYLADGNSNTIVVFSVPRTINWGIPAPSADIVATVVGDPSKAVIFEYEPGQLMHGGFPAPARRLAFYADQNAWASSNATGAALIDKSAHWGAGAGQPTPTPTPVYAVELGLYSQRGELLRREALCRSNSPITSMALSSEPWNANAGPLKVASGSWSCYLSGADVSGAVLESGVYLLVLESSGLGAKHRLEKPLVVMGGDPKDWSVRAAPNPAGKGSRSVDIFVSGAALWSVKVYAGDGMQVASFSGSGTSARWEFKNAASGIYFAVIHKPGAQRPKIVKIAVAR